MGTSAKPTVSLPPEAAWMEQILSGTIHNIGNVITVARLSLSELEQACGEDKDGLVQVILKDLLPVLETHAAAGTVNAFLRDDPQGREYLGALRQLLEQQQLLQSENRRLVGALARKLQHISEIVTLQQQLLAGIGLVEPEPVRQLLEVACTLLAEAFPRHGVQLHREDVEVGEACVDGALLTQVFVNLLKNAVEALDQVNDRPRQVWVRTRREAVDGQDWLIGEVADNGPGIPPELQEKVFEFGFSTKTGRRAGRGVGLHFSRTVVVRQGGRLTLHSQPGAGSCFTVWLRACAPPAAAPAPS